MPSHPHCAQAQAPGAGAMGTGKPLGAGQVARACVAGKVTSLQTGSWDLFPKAAAFGVFSKSQEQSGGATEGKPQNLAECNFILFPNSWVGAWTPTLPQAIRDAHRRLQKENFLSLFLKLQLKTKQNMGHLGGSMG